MLVLFVLMLLASVGLAYRPLRVGRSHSATILAAERRVERVSELTEKQRLDVYLSTVVGRSRSFVGDLCDRGLVLVNEKKVSKSSKVGTGDLISYEVEENAEVSKVEPENIPLDILFEDDDIIAINKPNGMVVHPAPGSPNNTFVNALLFHLGPAANRLTESPWSGIDSDSGDEAEEDEVFVAASDLPETPEAAVASHVSLRPGVVHRLDKGTSGVLLAGKHPEAVAKLSALFAARQVTKLYLAVCVGHPGEATIVDAIGRSQKNRQLMAVYDGPPGKPAVSHVKTLAFDGKLSVALVRIETGRTHQIRVHLKERRTPIAGDEAYGNSDWNKRLSRGGADDGSASSSGGVHRPLLHAYETQLQHPFTGKLLTLRAPLPNDMAQLIVKINGAGAPPLLDPEGSGLLAGTTPAVQGRAAGDQGNGFVPLDRIALADGAKDWTMIELPEEPVQSQSQTTQIGGRKRRRL